MKTRTLIATLVLALVASTVGFMYALGGGPFAEAAEADVATGVDPELLAANLVGDEAATDDAGRDGDAEPARRVDGDDDDDVDDVDAVNDDDDAADKAVADDGATDNLDHADDHADDDHADDDHTDDDHADDGAADDHAGADDHNDDGVVTPPVIECTSGYAWDHGLEKCVEIPPVIIDCAPGYAWDHHLEKCVEIPPVIIDCIPGFLYDHDLEKCVEIPVPDCEHGTIYVEAAGECVPVIIDCIAGFVYDYDLEKCVEVDVPLPICPLTHFVNDHGECEPFDFEIPELIVCLPGEIRVNGTCVEIDLDLDLTPLGPVLPPVRVNPDLLPDINPGLLDPVLDPARLDLGFGG